jgi:programmed cell death 8 (apoptosis-inducing factor)
MFLVRKGFHYRQTLSFSSKVNSNKKSSTKLAVPVLLLSAIALFGPGYFLIKPKIEKKLISEEQLKENVELNYPKGCSFSQYILVGGGTSAIAALEAIREKEPQAKVLIISEDKNEPYQRPPLTKELWWDDRNHENDLTFMNWQGRKTSLFYLPSESYSLLDRKNVSKALSTETSKVHLLLDTSVKKIDTESKNITLDNGEVVFFNKILVATGSRPFLPSFLENMDQSIKNRVMTYRGIEDFKMLTEKVKKCRNIVVVGGGFLGTELSYSLKKKAPSLKITQIFPEEGNLSLILPSYLSKWTSKKLSEKGVLIQAQSEVVKINEGVDGCVDVIMNDGGAVTADLVIVSAGSVPNVELARKSNLEIDPVLNGIIGILNISL